MWRSFAKLTSKIFWTAQNGR